MRRGVLTGVVLSLALAAGAPAAVAQSAGAKAAAAREQNFKSLGAAFKAIRDELGNGSPDKAVLQANARKMNTLAGQLPSWFPRGSGPESGAKQGAKAEVWTDAAGFAAAARNLQGETAKFQQVAMAGDIDAMKAGVRGLGGACKTCHDKYRVPEK